jgi:hypothetical protein
LKGQPRRLAETRPLGISYRPSGDLVRPWRAEAHLVRTWPYDAYTSRLPHRSGFAWVEPQQPKPPQFHPRRRGPDNRFARNTEVKLAPHASTPRGAKTRHHRFDRSRPGPTGASPRQPSLRHPKVTARPVACQDAPGVPTSRTAWALRRVGSRLSTNRSLWKTCARLRGVVRDPGHLPPQSSNLQLAPKVVALWAADSNIVHRFVR